MREHDVAGGAFDQGRDRGLVAGAEDQIAFPVPWHRAVLGLCRSFADHQHRGLEALTSLVGSALRPADSAAGAQTPGQFSTQLAAALDIEGLVDRLVRHAHLRLLRELQPQPAADLFRAPSSAKTVRDRLPQPRVLCDLAPLRPTPAPSSPTLRSPGPVVARTRMGVAAQFAADRRWDPVQPLRDPPNRVALAV